MKVTRRDFAAGAAMLAALSSQAAVSAEKQTKDAPKWRPYSDTIAIDAMGGFGRMGGTGDGTYTDLELADVRASGLTAVRLSLAPEGAFWFNDAAYQTTLRRISETDRSVLSYPDVFTRVLNGADLARAHRERKVGLIYGFQETSPIGEDVDRIEIFHQAGVRLIQLTHNRRNLVGDGSMEPSNAGISNLGHKIIEGLNAKRIVVDLAHGGRRTMNEGIAASKSPAIISHTGCAALSDHPRCAPDDTLRLMAERGGVAGIIFWPYLRKDTQPMAIDVIRHIEHAINVCGEDHVGIGTDGTVSAYDRTPQFETENRAMIKDMVEQGIFEAGRPQDLYVFIPDLNDVRRFEILGAMLAARGHSDTRIAKILGGNFARVMSEVWG
ncbi:MAG: membrane dipeptidase [Proteobacteria bacterium]|nr:membrane dipeptidase [Pseudomonadota bacterium]